MSDEENKMTENNGAAEEPCENTEEKAALSREQILEMSRKENKNGDEREAQSMGKAMRLAYSVGLLVIGIVQIIAVIVNDEIPLQLYIVYTAMTATVGIYSGVKMSKHRALYLASGIVGAVCCAIFIVLWILKLCGVDA